MAKTGIKIRLNGKEVAKCEIVCDFVESYNVKLNNMPSFRIEYGDFDEDLNTRTANGKVFENRKTTKFCTKNRKTAQKVGKMKIRWKFRNRKLQKKTS